MRIFRTEIFSLVLVIMTFGLLEDALDPANDSRYALFSAIFTSDVTSAHHYVDGIDFIRGDDARGDEQYLGHVHCSPLALPAFKDLSAVARHIGVTANFREVIDYFKVPAGETPAGFRITFVAEPENLIRVNLVRDISRDKNGHKRPTDFLYSADSANPYEVAPIKDLIANLTSNPGIIYDRFINNPKATSACS